MITYSCEALKGEISFSEVSPRDITKDDSKFNQIFKLFGEFDAAEIEYYKKLSWHWDTCSEKEVRENLNNKVRRMFVASANDTGEYVGFITLYDSKMGADAYTCAQFVVAKSHRGKHIGRKLLEYMFKQTKGKYLYLTVTATNEAGKHLYESVGFKTLSMWMFKKN